MHFLKVLRAVLWSLTGIGRGTKDLESARPATLIAVGLLVAALLVAGIVTVVRLVTRDSARPGAAAVSASAPVGMKRHGPLAVPDTMEERVVACVQCHSSATEATKDGFSPRIAGKPAGYLFNQLVSFRDGRRPYPPLVYLVQYMSDDYLREIADYFSRLDLPYPPSEKTILSPSQTERARQVVR